MLHNLIPVPRVLARWFFRNASIFNMGLLIAWIACGIITYKVRQANGGKFRDLVLGYLYGLNLFLGFNTLCYHPFYNTFWSMLAGLPAMVYLLRLAHYMITKFGIGGHHESTTHHQPVQHHQQFDETSHRQESAPDAQSH